MTADEEVGGLERALDRNWRQLRFEPALEAAYERDTGTARAWRQAACSLLGAGSFWMLSGADLQTLGAVADSLSAWRVAVTAAALVVVALLVLGRHAGRSFPREALSAAGTLVIAGYASAAAYLLVSHRGLMQGSGLLLVFLHVGIAARLQFRYAVAVNAISFLAYAACARGGDPESFVILHNHLLLFAVVAVFSTAGNYLLEFRERRNYLLACLKAARHRALVADAEALRERSLRDGLTDLFNRRHFDSGLAAAWANAQRDGTPVGLLQVDIDHFKRFNDHYGHPAGDACLVRVAQVLAATASRHGGFAARVGGEEFALLLPGQDEPGIVAVAADVCEAVRALALPHAKSSSAAHVTVSVGAAAMRPLPGTWASSLVGAADVALYAAKGAGRDRFAEFAEPLAPEVSPRQRKAPEPTTTEDAESPREELERIERFSGLLGRRLLSLRFPADLETEFQERDSGERRRQLAFFSVGGLAATLVYIALCRPVFEDIATRILERILALSMVAIAVAAVNLRFDLGWRIREGLFAGTVGALGLAIVVIEAQSRAPTVYSATLGLCLLPMFCALVAAQPLRFCAVPSAVICLGVATLMAPDDPQRTASWVYALGVICLATVYSLVGGYLLEHSNRRAYLLDRLRLAQLAVLRVNTARLQRLATLDPLTRLPNRRHFETELERLAAACSVAREPLALLILDIDHFKHYNDGYGHPEGDACLQRIGTVLRQWARPGGASPGAGKAAVPARIGGEEFGVLLPGLDATAALAAGQRLRLQVRELAIEHAHSPVGRFVTVSVGAASLVLASAADTRLLLKAADAALYRAKGSGRDQAAA